VGNAVRDGHLVAFADGSLDPKLVGTGWRERNRRADEGGKEKDGVTGKLPKAGAALPASVPIKLRPGEAPAEAAARLVSEGGDLVSRAEADRRTAHFASLLKQLEWDERSAAVVPVEMVVPIVLEQFATVKNRLLAIPSECAPRLHRCKTVTEVQAVLADIIHQVLTELSSDRVEKLIAKPPRRNGGR
jgi:hypothetical protein